MESVKDTFNCKQVFLDSKHLHKRYLSKDTSKDWSIQSFRHSFLTLLAAVEQNGAVITKEKIKHKYQLLWKNKLTMARTPKNIPFIYNKAIPFFFSFSVKCVSWYGSVGQIEEKQAKKKIITRSLRIGGPGTPGWR